MSKIITSPVERFPGTVTLSDPLTYPQLIEYVKARDTIAEQNEELTMPEINYIWLKVIFDCVEEWRLENIPNELTVDTFPSTPFNASTKLLSWLTQEVTDLIVKAEEVPNE